MISQNFIKNFARYYGRLVILDPYVNVIAFDAGEQ